MRRFFSADPKLVFLLGLTVFGAFAWLTRHPDSEVVRQAESWPVVGPLASRFKAAYSWPTRDSRASRDWDKVEDAIGQERVVVDWVFPDRVKARSQVWLEPGARVQVSPEAGSEVLVTIESLGNYSLVERHGDWFHIRRYSADQGVLDGWTWLPGYEAPTAERLQRPDPVLPMESMPPDTARARRARSLMEERGVETSCEPYTFLTEGLDPHSLEYHCVVASSLEEIYRERFGLNPIGEPAEAIFLFGSQDAYREFVSDDEAIRAEGAGHASPSRGYVALYSEDLPREEVASTRIHELTHLINRRALGPALPPWLEEGLADDLAESRLDESGRLIPGELGGYSQASGAGIRHFGGVVSASRLIKALDGSGLPDLSELVQMGSEEFHSAQRESLLYALSSFWIRFLLSDAPGADPEGFRAFLEAVAAGELLTPDLLARSLDADEAELDASFETWLRFQAAPLPQAIAFDR